MKTKVKKNKKNGQEWTTLALRITPEQKSRLDKAAKLTGRSMNFLALKMIGAGTDSLLSNPDQVAKIRSEMESLITGWPK